MSPPPRELSPRAVARLLAPEWRIDAPVLDGSWTLADVHATGRAECVVLELARGARRLALAVEPGGGAPPEQTAGGLAASWLAPGPPDAGHAAALELARILRAKLGDARPRWAMPPSAVRLVPDAVAREVRAEPARLDEDPDGALLSADAASYARLYGSAPRAVRVTLRGAAPRGVSVHHPAPIDGTHPPSGRLYEVPHRFHRRRFRRYFAALGCTYEDGVPRTVPTPTTFAAAAEAALGHPPPLCPRLERGGRPSIDARRWAARVVDATLPVAVAPRWAVALHRTLRRVEGLSHIPVDVGMLAHDVSLHALGLHAVDPAGWEALTRTARERLRRPGRGTARAVAAFFEGTLTRTAWDVWNALEAPEGFAAAFAARVDELEAELRGL